MDKTWFVTGASRGLGAEIVHAALRAGDRVVATARRHDALVQRFGADRDRLLPLALDVTRADEAQAAVAAALARFGAIDVLVNNAGYGHVGYFEETTDADARAQFETNVFGALHVTRAALPAMRAARRGRVLNVSSLGGIVGGETASLYCATKFALEGFSESLAAEVAPFGIGVTIVEPGPFRTEFLSPDSLRFGATTVADYDDRRARMRAAFEARDGHQPVDPVRLADALVALVDDPAPPLRFTAGASAVEGVQAKLTRMQAELAQWAARGRATDGDW